MTLQALTLASTHIIKHLTDKRPLFVALQGPQGSGKSYLAKELRSNLGSPPHSLRVAVLSLDDLYLPHDGLVALAASSNVLWRGRGQPGTHDITLGIKILSALMSGNGEVELPRFDKSLFDGEGDRLPMDGTGTIILQPPPPDVVILEGWFVGFYPISEEELQLRWHGTWKEERQKLKLEENEIGRLSDIQAVNDKLKDYVQIWDFFDIFLQLKANTPSNSLISQYSVVYKWRLEQEHYMKAQNGGRGMSDDAVKSFVDRYIPGYVFFGDIPLGDREHTRKIRPKWTGKGLILCLDDNREVTGATSF